MSKCGYCSFYSIAAPHLIDGFVKALIGEMALYTDAFDSFDTVYFGGGTPSLLHPASIEKILDAARRTFVIDRQAEITLESNPGDVSSEYFHFLRSMGINRLNIGVQSFDDGILKFLGRRHTAKDALNAVDEARRAGFENIGIDLIYGIRGQDISHWRQTLKTAVSINPEHLSCYQLSLAPQTPLYTHYQREGFNLPSEDEALAFFTVTSQALADSGYCHYEVSNFARSLSFRSRHNMKYWRHVSYLGLGPAAHSFSAGRRWWNKEDAHGYIADIASSRPVVSHSEELTAQQLALEALFLGLRTREGIDPAQYKTIYGIDLLAEKAKAIDELIKNKLLEIKDGRLCPTTAGMAVADSLALI
jgi:oxygen-independent coproporphyrinogen-3 oxidase